MVCYSHLLHFPQFAVIHTVKGISVFNEAEVDFFFWNSLAFSVIQGITFGIFFPIRPSIHFWYFFSHPPFHSFLPFPHDLTQHIFKNNYLVLKMFIFILSIQKHVSKLLSSLFC